ncbi:12594_t:CDS:2 [Gigaspora margarita]|uniref:12594_t:CDS:1 n=1 Tax=Gigaspora margarita TaxID=4874 RepID=A0ABN7VS64_GIGMA|nr:12594_t:CDS:2 [Gigaspora margarita]
MEVYDDAGEGWVESEKRKKGKQKRKDDKKKTKDQKEGFENWFKPIAYRSAITKADN